MNSFDDAMKTFSCEVNPNIVILHHGTKNNNFSPDFNFNNNENDYGKGLYTTRDLELAKEWAMSFYSPGETGYIYSYELDLSDMLILDLREYDILYWLATTIKNRPISNVKGFTKKGIEFLISNYALPVEAYDVIIGWRLDDSYFKFAKDFARNEISFEALNEAVHLGDLGLQYTLKSKKAFDSIKLIEKHWVDDRYKELFVSRITKANELYEQLRDSDDGKTFIVNMMR